MGSGIEQRTIILDKTEEPLRSAEFLWWHGQYRVQSPEYIMQAFLPCVCWSANRHEDNGSIQGYAGCLCGKLSVQGVLAAECCRLRQRLRALHDARIDADYTLVAIDETIVQAALAIAREILEIVQRYEQR